MQKCTRKLVALHYEADSGHYAHVRVCHMSYLHHVPFAIASRNHMRTHSTQPQKHSHTCTQTLKVNATGPHVHSTFCTLLYAQHLAWH